MIWKRLSLGLAALAIMSMATAAFAEVTITRRALSGKVSRLETNDSRLEGILWTPDGGGQPESFPPGNLYDAIPTGAGGLGTPGTLTAIPGFDWVGTAAGWGDDIHAVGTSGITTLQYGYVNTGTTTEIHTVYIGQNLTGTFGTSPVPTLVTIGVAPIATVTGIAAPPGTFIQTLVFTSAQGAGVSDYWVHLLDGPAGGAGSFFLTTMTPGLGVSHDLGGYGLGGGGNTATYPLGGPAIGLPGPFNNAIALNNIPEPATIGLLALAGLIVLGWRRR